MNFIFVFPSCNFVSVLCCILRRDILYALYVIFLFKKKLIFFKLSILLRNCKISIFQSSFFKLYSDPEVPGSGMIFPQIQILLKVSDPNGSGSTTLLHNSDENQITAPPPHESINQLFYFFFFFTFVQVTGKIHEGVVRKANISRWI
jgi:hypothetical protein